MFQCENGFGGGVVGGGGGGGGGGMESHIKAIWDMPPFRVGFLDLWLVNRVTDSKNFTFLSQTGSKIRHKFEQRPTS